MLYIEGKINWILKWGLSQLLLWFWVIKVLTSLCVANNYSIHLEIAPRQSHESEILLYFSLVYSGNVFSSGSSKTSSGLCHFRGVLKVDTLLSTVALKVFLGPIASASPGNWPGMLIPRPPLHPLSPHLWGWGPAHPPNDSAAHGSLRIVA